MQRLCTERSCTYSGRSVQHAVGAAMGVELRPGSKGTETPSNPKVAVVAMGAGLRAVAKAAETPPDPTATRAAHPVATPGVIEQKSAEAVRVSTPHARRGTAKGRTRMDKEER